MKKTLKKTLKIVDEFSSVKYKNITRNIFYENINGYRKISLRMMCPVDKKVYNKYWSLRDYSYSEAINRAILHLNYINDRKRFGFPLRFHNIKYWTSATEFILI